MQQVKSMLLKAVPNFLATFAVVFSVVGANSACCCIFHQPEKPDMKKLRKY